MIGNIQDQVVFTWLDAFFQAIMALIGVVSTMARG